MELTYTRRGDYIIPAIVIHQPGRPLSRWGRERKRYLEKHRPVLYNQLVLSEKLYDHCLEIEDAALSRMEQMIPQLAEAAGATEALKAADPMKWVDLMNACRNQAEEIIWAELIYG